MNTETTDNLAKCCKLIELSAFFKGCYNHCLAKVVNGTVMYLAHTNGSLKEWLRVITKINSNSNPIYITRSGDRCEVIVRSASK